MSLEDRPSACPLLLFWRAGGGERRAGSGTHHCPRLRAIDGPSLAQVCWHTVKRTTVKLPDDLDARLRHEAARRESTVAEVTREAIEIHLGGGKRRRLIAAKSERSGQHDTARRIEEIIRQETGRSR